MSNDFYIISTNSYIKNVSKYLDMNFLEELKTSSNELKPHIKDLDINANYCGKKCIKCTIPTLFIEVEYKTKSDKCVYLIEHEVFLYEEDYPTMEALKNYKNKFDFNFASQVNKEVYEIVEAFHQGFGCMCLSSEEY
jgi:tRNA/tmRNA/rRNA uracil-C5-methylase (TrmA/RlmC/RlmD family)